MTDVSTETKSIKSLFNAKAIALKYVRDFAIASAAFAAPVLLHKSGLSISDWAVPIAIGGAMTAICSSAGRYVGGAIGTGIDVLINKSRDKTPFEKSYLRKPLAGVFGIAIGGAVYLSTAGMAGLFGNLNVTEAQPDQTQRVVIDTPKPQAKLG